MSSQGLVYLNVILALDKTNKSETFDWFEDYLQLCLVWWICNFLNE